MKKLIPLILWVNFSMGLFGQQEAQYSMYMFNALVLNPAYSGSAAQFSGVMTGRWQWAGMERAPKTQSLGLHTPTVNRRHGFGFTLVNDQLGYSHNTNVQAAYAYRIPFGKDRELALGLQAGLDHYRVDLSQVSTLESGDNAFNGQDFRKTLFESGTGIWYQSPHFYTGFSVPNLIPNRLYDLYYEHLGGRKVPHMYSTIGGLIPLGSSLHFRPSALLKLTPNGQYSVDLHAALWIKERFWAGMGWRSSKDWVLMCQLQLGNKLKMGYSYDLPYGVWSRQFGGSHELMVGFDLASQKTNVTSPRFY